MPIYVPKEIIHLSPSREAPLIFLVGPIRGGADWQAMMCELILKRNPDTNIACPCRWDETHELAPYFYQPFIDGLQYPRQRRWEEHYIQQAAFGTMPGCVLANLKVQDPNDTLEMEGHQYATDTRREMGKFAGWLKFARNIRLVVGGDDGFYGRDTLMDDLNTSGDQFFPFYDNPESLVNAAFEMAEQ